MSIIVRIVETAVFKSQPSLTRYCHITSGFHFLELHKSNFLAEQGRLSCVQPLGWMTEKQKGWFSYAPRHASTQGCVAIIRINTVLRNATAKAIL
jgi:hypothetical protein